MDKLRERLSLHIVKLAEKIGERNFLRYKALEEAKDYISGKFEEYGYEPTFQEYNSNGKSYKNIIAEIKGEEKDSIVIIGAHYDSVLGSPGADDNASGVAAILELACLLFGEKLKRTLRMVAFVNEEPPFFGSEEMGSMVYAKVCKERGERIDVTISLEMIGYYSSSRNSQTYPPPLGLFYPDRGDFIAVVGNKDSKDFMKKMAKIFEKKCRLRVESMVASLLLPGADLSDHASFWRYGYKGVMVTDTGFYRNPNYHKETDLPETLNYESLADVVMGLYYVLLSIGNKE
jgi:Zn-dependent M28 family amino/carboxypeptidase